MTPFGRRLVAFLLVGLAVVTVRWLWEWRVVIGLVLLVLLMLAIALSLLVRYLRAREALPSGGDVVPPATPASPAD